MIINSVQIDAIVQKSAAKEQCSRFHRSADTIWLF